MQLNKVLKGLMIALPVMAIAACSSNKNASNDGSEGTTEWNSVMAAMLLTLIPPVVIVLVMQRAFVRGLVDSEK